MWDETTMYNGVGYYFHRNLHIFTADPRLKRNTTKMITEIRHSVLPEVPDTLQSFRATLEETLQNGDLRGGFFEAHGQCGVILYDEGIIAPTARPRQLILNRVHSVSARDVAWGQRNASKVVFIFFFADQTGDAGECEQRVHDPNDYGRRAGTFGWEIFKICANNGAALLKNGEKNVFLLYLQTPLVAVVVLTNHTLALLNSMWDKFLELVPRLAETPAVFLSPDKFESRACATKLRLVPQFTTPHHTKKALLQAMNKTGLKGDLVLSTVLGLFDLPEEHWLEGIKHLDEALLLNEGKLAFTTHLNFFWKNHGRKAASNPSVDVPRYGAAHVENNLRAFLQPENVGGTAKDFWTWFGEWTSIQPVGLRMD